jgi:ParB-like chromosome segregation protein Spo0J
MLKWELDNPAISVIDRLGLQKTIEEVSAAAIDVAKSRINKARPLPIDKDTVEDYAESMKRGDLFPCIVLRRIGRKYVIAGGNHRHEAAKSIGETAFTAIVVVCDDDEFDVLCKKLNLSVGRREPRSVRVDQAVELVNTRSIDIAEAAREMEVPESSVADRLRSQEVTQSLVSIGVYDKVQPTHARLMYQIRKDTAILPLVADLSAKRKVSIEELRGIIKAAKDLGTEKDRMEFLRAEIEKRKSIRASGQKLSRKVKTAIVRGIGVLEVAVGGKETLCQIQMSREECLGAVKRLTELLEKVKKIALTHG